MTDQEKYELNDRQLELVNGGAGSTPIDDGYMVGDRVVIHTYTIQYCNGCGRLLNGSTAVITGHRGVLDGANIWWITRDCCGHRTSEIATAFSHP